MIIGKMKNDVDKLWLAFHTGGITNPVNVIEQINYLLFCRRLDDIETRNERVAERTKEKNWIRIFPKDKQHLRWSNFKHLKASEMYKLVQEEVFPFIKSLGAAENEGSTFAKTLADAVFMIQKPSNLLAAVELISNLDLDNSDTSGDLYEYMLSQLTTSGINGQFRTPRHIIRMMVEITEPQKSERICDPACGTAGFLFMALQYLLEENTSKNLVHVDEDGYKHGFVGDLLTKAERKKFQNDTFYGFEIDSTMLRVGAMNMWLHGIESPQVKYADTLSQSFVESNRYDLILANPPFKGKLDHADCSPSLLAEVKTKNTELLFLVLALRLLDIGGRAAIIVPEGVLFNASAGHLSARRLLVEEHQLEGVISMPSGVFKPYAGVSTAVLIFSKGGNTDRVWFYDMEHDGYSLDDKRQKVDENDIPDLVHCWKHRLESSFNKDRTARLSALREKMVPMKRSYSQLQQDLEHRSFEMSLESDADFEHRDLISIKESIAKLETEMHHLQKEFNQNSRQFWVEKSQIVDSNYDLRASQYRQIEIDEVYFPSPETIVTRLRQLQNASNSQLVKIEALI